MIFGLSNWKDGVAIYCDEQTAGGAGLEQKM